MCSRRLMALGLLLGGLWLAAGGLAAPVRAEAVQLRHEGRTLNAELALPAGATIRNGIVVLVHGTLMHGRMEIMAALQNQLAARGVASLAITLSLGIDDRRGPYDCAVPHRHTLDATAAEIGAWTRWAQAQGATRVDLAGHSRGGAQAAYAVAGQATGDVRRLILIAPTTFDPDVIAAGYEKAHGTPLAPQLAEATRRMTAPDAPWDPMGFLYCRDAQVAPLTFVDTYTSAERHDTPTLLGGMTLPTLVVIAGNDEIVPDLARRVAPVPGKVRVQAIDGADHFFRDLYGEDLADAVAAFVKS